MAVFTLFGGAAGFFGGLLGVAFTASRDWGIPESSVAPALYGGPVIGAACGFAIGLLQPRRPLLEGCLNWIVLILFDVCGSALCSGVVFYGVARMMRT